VIQAHPGMQSIVLSPQTHRDCPVNCKFTVGPWLGSRPEAPVQNGRWLTARVRGKSGSAIPLHECSFRRGKESQSDAQSNPESDSFEALCGSDLGQVSAIKCYVNLESRCPSSRAASGVLGHKMAEGTKSGWCAQAHKPLVLRDSLHQTVCGDWLLTPQARWWERCDIHGCWLHFAYSAWSFLLSCVIGYVLVDSAHTSSLKAKRCRWSRVMRLPRLPLARGQCPISANLRICCFRIVVTRAQCTAYIFRP